MKSQPIQVRGTETEQDERWGQRGLGQVNSVKSHYTWGRDPSDSEAAKRDDDARDKWRVEESWKVYQST